MHFIFLDVQVKDFIVVLELLKLVSYTQTRTENLLFVTAAFPRSTELKHYSVHTSTYCFYTTSVYCCYTNKAATTSDVFFYNKQSSLNRRRKCSTLHVKAKSTASSCWYDF